MNISLLVGLLPLLFVTFVIFKLVISPWWKLRFYKNQGLFCYFYPLLGFVHRSRLHERQYNDLLAYSKRLPKEKPNFPAEASHFGHQVVVILYDPKAIGEYYSNQSKYTKANLAKGIKSLAGTGLLFAEGNLWKRHRKIISNIFHFEFLKQNVPLIVSTTREFLDNLSRTSMKNVSIMDEIQKITGEIVGRIFFGDNLNQHTLKGQPLTLYLANLLARPAQIMRNPFAVALFLLGLDKLLPSYRQYTRDVQEFRKVSLQIVKNRKASQVQKNDLLGLLLERQELKNSEDYFSDNDIVNEFITFFLAGMDTTGHLITMALYLLYKNPTYIDKLENEISEFYDKNNVVGLECLNKMDLMHGVLKEALRIYTPVPGTMNRVALEDHQIMGINIRKGDAVRPMPFYNYFNEKYFEDPERFYPERWIKKNQNLDLFVDISFSAGARNCIGQHLAMIEAKIILAEFIRRFRFDVVPEDYKLVMVFNFLYEPREKLLLDLVCKK